jgi:hypothetical protein
VRVRGCLAVAAVLSLAGCAGTPAAPIVVPPVSAATTSDALPFARSSIVDPSIPAYKPTYFPATWAIVRGKCDTREVLLEKVGSPPVDSDGDGCSDDGSFIDVYTGNRITPKQAQIDHVFSKEQAWYAGLYKLTQDERKKFYNDQLNLLPVTGSVNESKGDKGPASWSPISKSGVCTYARVYSATAVRWNLTVTAPDAAALQRDLSGCPG